jgi:hypothetical protein
VRRQDIKPDMVVAVPQWNRASRDELSDRTLLRARVEAIVEDGAPTEHIGYGYKARQTARKRIVQVRMLNRDDVGTAGPVRYYEPREVAATWGDYLAAKLEAKERREAIAEEFRQREEKTERTGQELTDLLNDLDLPELAALVRAPRGASANHESVVTLTASQVAKLAMHARKIAMGQTP